MMGNHDPHTDHLNGQRKVRDRTRYQIALVVGIIVIGLAYLAWAHYLSL